MKNIILIVLLFTGIENTFSQKTNDFKWLTGSWEIKTPQGIVLEKWTIKNDSTLTGQSYFIAGKDSMPQEKIELKFRKGHWFYHPVLNGQNETNSTSFAIIYSKNEEFISENPAHDFPQRISYRKIDGKLYASIEGKNKDKYMKQNFDFVPSK